MFSTLALTSTAMSAIASMASSEIQRDAFGRQQRRLLDQ
jgi:hypothetical protein